MRGAMKVGATSPNYLPSPISAGDHSKAKGTFRQEAGTKVVNETLYSTKSGRAEVSGGQADGHTTCGVLPLDL